MAAFALEDGTEIRFDVDEAGAAEGVTRGLRRADVTERAEATFEEVARGLGAPLRIVLDSLREAAEGVDAVDLCFGIRFSVSAGAVISQVGGEANLSVTVHWTRPSR